MSYVLHGPTGPTHSCRRKHNCPSTPRGHYKGIGRHETSSWRLAAVKYPFESLIQQLKGTKESRSVHDEHYPETTDSPQLDCPIISCCGGGIFFFCETAL